MRIKVVDPPILECNPGSAESNAEEWDNVEYLELEGDVTGDPVLDMNTAVDDSVLKMNIVKTNVTEPSNTLSNIVGPGVREPRMSLTNDVEPNVPKVPVLLNNIVEQSIVEETTEISSNILEPCVIPASVLPSNVDSVVTVSSTIVSYNTDCIVTTQSVVTPSIAECSVVEASVLPSNVEHSAPELSVLVTNVKSIEIEPESLNYMKSSVTEPNIVSPSVLELKMPASSSKEPSVTTQSFVETSITKDPLLSILKHPMLPNIIDTIGPEPSMTDSDYSIKSSIADTPTLSPLIGETPVTGSLVSPSIVESGFNKFHALSSNISSASEKEPDVASPNIAKPSLRDLDEVLLVQPPAIPWQYVLAIPVSILLSAWLVLRR